MRELELDMRVMKVGRTTNVAYGYISHIKPDWAFKGNPALTKEFVVTGLKGALFSDEGDSGAFVLNEFGLLFGIIIGVGN